MKKVYVCFVVTGILLLCGACGNNGNAAAQISLSETVRDYATMSYGEFRERTGKEAELYHADRFIGEIPDSSLCIVYTGKYDEDLAGYTLSDDDVPIRMEGALGALLEGIDGEMPATELAAALSEGGAEAVCELSEGAGTAYYVGDRYADIQFDSDRDGAYDSRLLISLDDAAEEEVDADSAAWLEMTNDQAAKDSADMKCLILQNAAQLIRSGSNDRILIRIFRIQFPSGVPLSGYSRTVPPG